MHVDYKCQAMPTHNIRQTKKIGRRCSQPSADRPSQISHLSRRSKRFQMSVFHFPLGCLPSIPFCNSLPPSPSPPSLPLFPSGGGINYTVARDRTRPFKFRLFPADAEIELGIGAAEWSADDEGASERRIHTSEDKLKVLRGCKNS